MEAPPRSARPPQIGETEDGVISSQQNRGQIIPFLDATPPLPPFSLFLSSRFSVFLFPPFCGRLSISTVILLNFSCLRGWLSCLGVEIPFNCGILLERPVFLYGCPFVLFDRRCYRLLSVPSFALASLFLPQNRFWSTLFSDLNVLHFPFSVDGDFDSSPRPETDPRCPGLNFRTPPPPLKSL